MQKEWEKNRRRKLPENDTSCVCHLYNNLFDCCCNQKKSFVFCGYMYQVFLWYFLNFLVYISYKTFELLPLIHWERNACKVHSRDMEIVLKVPFFPGFNSPSESSQYSRISTMILPLNVRTHTNLLGESYNTIVINVTAVFLLANEFIIYVLSALFDVMV